MSVRVKICGLTTAEDVAAAVEAGADALGFVMASSPRRLSLGEAANLVRGVPPFVARVGVFVDPTPAELEEALARCGFDWLQLHGEEPPSLCARFRPRVLKAIRVSRPADVALLEDYRDSAAGILLDSRLPGTGMRFDWAWAEGLGDRCRLVLAGGLDAGNVAHAVSMVRPWAVDVSSRVESSPGRKDPALVRAFVLAARRA